MLYGIKAADVKRLNLLIFSGIRVCLEQECIRPELIERYIADCGAITYTKTASGKAVARLNRLCERAKSLADGFTTDTLLQTDILPYLNNDIVTDGKVYYLTSVKLAEDISRRYDMSAYCARAVELEIRLRLASVCRRRIIVPVNYTFRRLHHLLQRLFCREDYHLYAFLIEQYPERRGKYTLVGTDDEDDMTHSDRKVRLSEIFPAYDHIIYNYDFGDDWIHDIKVVRMIDDYDSKYPVCTEGEGDAPPEDTGGPAGYAEMLRILSDPNDPEYEFMNTRVEDMERRKFNMFKINLSFKFI